MWLDVMKSLPITSPVRKKAVWGRSAVALVFCALLASPAGAQSAEPNKLDEAVRKAVTAGESTRTIIQFESTAERDAAFERLLDRGAAVRTMDTEGGPALNVVSSAATLMTEVDNAAQVSIDAKVSVFAAKKTPARAKPRARGVARKKAARGFVPAITVAVIDSGIAPNADLPKSHLVHYQDFVTVGTTPVDGCGHGTHVAGIVAGNGSRSGGEYDGVDPAAGLVVLRVLGNDCSGNTTAVIDALRWVADNHATYKIKVVNLSLGHPVFESIVTDPMVAEVEKLSRMGIVVVTAAGNMGINPTTGKPGYGGVMVPCNAPSAVCVGALDTRGTKALGDDFVAWFSSRGPSRFDFLAKPDLVADGVNVTSVAAKNSKIYGKDDDGKSLKRRVAGTNDVFPAASYLSLSGTSMASPQVAGAAALVLTVNPGLSANAVKMALQFTARKLPKADALTQGAGALNIVGAIRFASLVDPSADHGTNWITGGVLPKWNFDENWQRVRWGKRLIYGDSFAPDAAASVHMMRWDDNIVWGFDTLDENIVWGSCYGPGDDSCGDENIVWGNGLFDEDNIVWGSSWDDNIVWGNNNDSGEIIVDGDTENIIWGYWADNIVWGFWDDNIVWGAVTRDELDNIVWGSDWDNIVWGSCAATSAKSADDNVVWGSSSVVVAKGEAIVWGNSWDDNIVWGFADGDNIVWGNNCGGKAKGK